MKLPPISPCFVAVFLLGGGVCAQSATEDAAIDGLRSIVQLCHGNTFEWSVEHTTSPEAVLESRRVLERLGKTKPTANTDEVIKPDVYTKDIRTTFAGPGKFTSKVLVKLSSGKETKEEWLSPGNGLLYNTMFGNRQISIRDLSLMTPLTIIGGFTGSLQVFLSDSKIVRATETATSKDFFGFGKPDLVLDLRPGIPGIDLLGIWWRPGGGQIPVRLVKARGTNLNMVWEVVGNEYKHGVWPVRTNLRLFNGGTTPIAEESWTLRRVGIGEVGEIATVPELPDGFVILDETKSPPVFVTVNALKSLAKKQNEAKK